MVHVSRDNLRSVVLRRLAPARPRRGCRPPAAPSGRNVSVGIARRTLATGENSRISASRKCPPSTSNSLSISTPSSPIVRLSGGIEPVRSHRCRHGGLAPPRMRTARPQRRRKPARSPSRLASACRRDRIVQHIGIAAPDAAPSAALPRVSMIRPDAFTHRSQLHGNVRRVGD